MTGRKSRAEKNRTGIIRAATELFLLQGIKKVSVSDIAQKAGVTPATIYNQFGSKDVLVREVIIEWFSKTLEDYKQVLESAGFRSSTFYRSFRITDWNRA